MTFTVAITGRPNVGKSTLFNRLVGKRLALVHDQPGVTRDRREGEAQLGDLTFKVIDTAGFDEASGENLEARIQQQTDIAIEEADVSLFLIDARAGITPHDQHFADQLRRRKANVVLVANKCESVRGDEGFYDAFRLGMGDPVAISAEHGEGMSDIYRALVAAVSVSELEADDQDTSELNAPEKPDRPIQLAIVGRPNVGKSTLVNQMLGKERVLTGPVAGTTRDSISVDWEWEGRPFKLFDTAGVRRRSRVSDKIEKLSVSDTLRAIRFADVVVLLMEPEQAFDKQDLQIADLVADEGRAIIIAFNKWDLVGDTAAAWADLKERTDRLLPQIAGVPIVRLSALQRRGLEDLMSAIEQVHKNWSAQVKTPDLNQWLGEIEERHPPPAVRGRRIRLRYMSQIKTRPPTFVLFASRASQLPESYKRYLVNGIRRAFDFPGVPIRMRIRQGKNPYVEKD